MNQPEFEAFVKKYQHSIVRLIERITDDVVFSTDLAQDAFIKFYHKQKSVFSEKRSIAFLYRIAANLAVDHLRKKKPQSIDSIENQFSIKQDGIENSEIMENIRICSAKLKPRQRAVFILRDIEGFTIREVAEILKISEGNVRSNLHLARKNLKDQLFIEFQIDERYFDEL